MALYKLVFNFNFSIKFPDDEDKHLPSVVTYTAHVIRSMQYALKDLQELNQKGPCFFLRTIQLLKLKKQLSKIYKNMRITKTGRS